MSGIVPPPVTGGGIGGGGPPLTGDNPPVVLINNLDVGNPLYVHNSDNSSYVLVPFKLLGTANYRMDSFADSEVLCAQWDRCNAMVLTWIMNVVSSDVYMGLVYSENAASVWKELNETYDKVDGSVVYNLLQKIGSVKQGGSTVADYYHRLNSLWREFDAITKLPKCVCPVKCSCAASTELALHQQLMKLMQFLMGLDDCYKPIRTALLTRDPLPDVKDAYATVFKEESHRGIPETSEAIDTKINATSFAAKSYNKKRGNTNNINRNNTRSNGPNHYNRGPNPNLVCKNYGFTGHTIERCYELIGYPPGYKKGPNASKQNGFKPNFNANCDTKGSDKQPSACNSPTSFTTDQMHKLLNLINDTSSGNTHANMAGRISFFNGNAWFNVNFSKFYCGNTKSLVKTITLVWIIDSGANQHLTTSTIGMINVVDISNLNIIVGHPNGTVATISHKGDLRLSNNVMLHDVLIVPGYCVSLLSVNKLIKDSKLFVGFDEDNCYIQDLDKGITLGTGSESGGLYLFDDTKNKSLDLVTHLTRAKQTREPFPLSDQKSEKPGELVHLDLWGPYKVSSREGFKYFLTIVDDYSREVWTYLLKTKDEVFDCLVNFIKLIHNQFNAKIKTFKSDNGTEFVNKKMFTLFSDLGIIHHTFCTHSPQQNGIAEREHRYLLNVAMSLMFQGWIPLNFWSDCILTAVYLINRLPSSVLNGSDKLTSRSEKYVLIGYSPVKKAYKLFSLDNRRVLFSRDV
ncbi:putative RNA-directed DNA polymerase, partial [Tanacetum coccineum]